MKQDPLRRCVQRWIRLGSQKRGQGFALVSTLIIIAMLTVMVMAFLQSVRMDRLTSTSYLGMLRARLVSDGALSLAIDRLQVLKEAPYSAVYELDDADGSQVDPAPYLFLARALVGPPDPADAAKPPEEQRPDPATAKPPHEFFASPPPGTPQRWVERHALFSTAYLDPDASVYDTRYFEPRVTPDAVETAAYSIPDLRYDGSATTRTLVDPDDILADINRRDPFDASGVVGLLDTSDVRLRIPVNWIYVRDHDGRIVGRYAFWVDDECSKIDLRTAGNTNDSGAHLRANGSAVDDIALEHMTDSDIGLNAADITGMIGWRSAPNPIPLTLEHFRYLTSGDPASGITDEIWGLIKGHLTIYSRHDDRAPDGKRKLAINQVVTDTTDPVLIQQQVETIRDAIDEVLPTFWTRAFDAPDPISLSPAEQDRERRIYLTRLAANIRDAVDTDRTATVILNDGSALAGSAPDPELNGTVPVTSPITSDLPLAVGKEDVPLLNEYTRLMKVAAEIPAGGSDYNVIVWPVHYVELVNLSGFPITYSDLGPNPFVRICNPSAWEVEANSGAQPPLRPSDIVMRLPTDFSIPANGFAVLTTDTAPFGGSQTGLLGSSSNRYQLTKGSGSGRWEPVNAGGQNSPIGANEFYPVRTRYHSSNRYRVQNDLRTQGYGQNDTRIVFANDEGLLDVALKIYQESPLYLGRNSRAPTILNTNVSGNTTSNSNNGGSGPRFRRGTPMANAEIQVVQANNKTVWTDGLGAYGTSFNSNRITQGSNNYSTNWNNSSWQSAWPEYTTDAMGNFRGRNQIFNNLGQLGFIFDPARREQEHRGGARTLRIGQSDDAVLTRVGVVSPSDSHARYTGGRGADDPADIRVERNAWNLLNVFRITGNDVDLLRGRINPNAAARGTRMLAARSLFHDFSFEVPPGGGTGSSLVGGKALREDGDGVAEVISAMRAEIAAGRPFLHEGDLSRLQILYQGSALAAGSPDVTMTSVSDAGREELFRRSANLLTTQSLSYSIHIVAQAGRFVAGDRFDTTGTITRRAVVELVPSYPSTTPSRVAPDSWETRILIDEFK